MTARDDDDEDLLRRVAARLDGGASVTYSMLVGHHLGVAVTIDQASEMTGDYLAHTTTVKAALPHDHPFAMFIYGHDRIEAAPAEVVDRLLDAEARAFLRESQSIEVTTDDGKLKLTLPGLTHDEETLVAAVRFVARIVGGVAAATAAADAAAPAPVIGPAYRGAVDDQPRDAARAARAAEVDRIHQARRARARKQERFGVIALLLVGGTLVVIMAVMGIMVLTR